MQLSVLTYQDYGQFAFGQQLFAVCPAMGYHSVAEIVD